MIYRRAALPGGASLRHQTHMGQNLRVPQEMAQVTKFIGLMGAVIGGHPYRRGQARLPKERGHSATPNTLGYGGPPINLLNSLL